MRVSVWWYDVVNAQRAEQLNPSPPGKPRTGFTLAEHKIPPISAKATAKGLPPIEVVHDPANAAGIGITAPERNAHYGIEGLSSSAPTSKEQKELRKALLLELAEAAEGPVP